MKKTAYFRHSISVTVEHELLLQKDSRVDMHEIRRDGAHPVWPLNRQGLHQMQLAATSNPGNRADCQAELTVSSPAVTETIHRPTEAMAEWAWIMNGLENTGMV